MFFVGLREGAITIFLLLFGSDTQNIMQGYLKSKKTQKCSGTILPNPLHFIGFLCATEWKATSILSQKSYHKKILLTRLSEGHVGYYPTFRRPGILRNEIVSGYAAPDLDGGGPVAQAWWEAPCVVTESLGRW